MTKTCIVIADGIRARFISVDAPTDVDLDGGPRLVEHRDLVNPEGDLPERELHSDRSGRAHGAPGGSAHGLDDHHGQRAERSRRFAQRVAEAIEHFVVEQEARHLLLVAPPRLLGYLRPAMDRKRLAGVSVTDIGEDLSRMPLQELQEVLAARGLVPVKQVPRGAVFRPRGQPVD